MKNTTEKTTSGWIGTVTLVGIMLGTHVLLTQTTDIEGWWRSAIAIAVGVVISVLASMVNDKRKRKNSTPRN